MSPDDSYSRQVALNWPFLSPGETVVWRGKPVRSKYTRKDAKQTLAGIPVAVFITFWMWMAIRIPRKGGSEGVMAWFFPAFGMLFVFQALYLVLGHYYRNWLEWQNVEYAVTNRRTVVRRGLWRIREVSRPHSDAPIEVKSHDEGRVGDIIFESTLKPNVRGFGQQIQAMFNPELRTGEFGLYAIENPGDVYRMILSQANTRLAGDKANM
jgi:hypothetical protein